MDSMKLGRSGVKQRKASSYLVLAQCVYRLAGL
jgi:hypothetical protein